MADLVSGRYGQSNPAWALFGSQANLANPEVPARSNAEWFGFAAGAEAQAASSGVGNAVAVPVDPGTVISKVTMLVTSQAASTPTHSFAALYAGTGASPALIGTQSADGLTAAIPVNAPFTFTLGAGYLIKPTDAPNGFIYVSFSVTGTATPKVLAVTGPTLAAWGTMVPPTGAPLFFSATHGSGLNGTAASTVTSQTNVAATPIVYLT
jgi:hypothetical protein